MLRSQFEFAFVLILSSIVICYSDDDSFVSFGETCRDDFNCEKPLICSETHQCVCSSTTNNVIDCLICPDGWTSWNHQRCLHFVTSDSRSTSHTNATEICSKSEASLIKMNHNDDLQHVTSQINQWIENQGKSEFIDFEWWIDILDDTGDFDGDYWCDENDVTQFIDEKACTSIQIDSNGSFCLNHVSCDAQLSYICQRPTTMKPEQSRFLGSLVGLFLPSKPSRPDSGQPAPPVPAQTQPSPVIIYQTPPPTPAPQKSSSNTTIIIVVVVAVVGLIMMVLLCCCSCGGALIWKKTTDSGGDGGGGSSRREKRIERTSLESTESA